MGPFYFILQQHTGAQHQSTASYLLVVINIDVIHGTHVVCRLSTTRYPRYLVLKKSHHPALDARNYFRSPASFIKKTHRQVPGTYRKQATPCSQPPISTLLTSCWKNPHLLRTRYQASSGILLFKFECFGGSGKSTSM